MKFLLSILIVFVLVATNPSPRQHQARIRDVVAAQASREMGDGIGGSFGRLIGAHEAAGEFVAAKVRYDNMFVCSLGRIDGKVVSFGVLNCVVLSN